MPKVVLRPLCYGERLRLREGTYPHARVREWLFNRREGEKIFLEHETKGYVWQAFMDDIDWEAYLKAKADKRRYRRSLLKLPIEYYLPDIKIEHSSSTLNISQEGLAVDLPEKVEVGQNLKLRLFVPAESPVEIFAKVVWINPPARKGEMHRSGMSITKLSISDRCKWEILLGYPNA